MKKNEPERRAMVCDLAVREAGDAQGESRTVYGTAIVFNAESEILDEWGERFREVIAPEAATMEFLNTQDIMMNLLHERTMTVARCNKGKGSMRLWVDERGVNFEFEAPKCDLGDQVLEMVRRGDYSGCSFEFYPKDCEIEEKEVNGEREVKITHKAFERLTALTIGMSPAYQQTSVNARELLGETIAGNEIPKKEDEEKDAHVQAEREEAMKREADCRRRELERMKREVDLL